MLLQTSSSSKAERHNNSTTKSQRSRHRILSSSQNSSQLLLRTLQQVSHQAMQRETSSKLPSGRSSARLSTLLSVSWPNHHHPPLAILRCSQREAGVRMLLQKLLL